MRPPGRLRSAPPRLRTAAPHSQLTCPTHSSPAMEATPPASAQGRRPQATAAPASISGLDFSLPPSLPTPPQDCAGPAPGSAEPSGLGRVLGLTSVASEERKYPHFMLEELLQHESNGQSPQCRDEDSANGGRPTAEAPSPSSPEGPKVPHAHPLITTACEASTDSSAPAI